MISLQALHLNNALCVILPTHEMDIWSVAICASSGSMLSVQPPSNEKMIGMQKKSAINPLHSIFASSALVKPHQAKNGLIVMQIFLIKAESLEMVLTRLESSTARLVTIGSVK